eukprot:8059773-Alexandrium_andersonii.AAC.1
MMLARLQLFATWQMSPMWPLLPSIAIKTPYDSSVLHGSEVCPLHAFTQLMLMHLLSADFGDRASSRSFFDGCTM